MLAPMAARLPLLLSLLVPSACRGGGAAARPPAQDDTTVAVARLARAGVAADRAAIRRVLRDSLETVVWVEPRVRGLPVFDRDVGYAFDAGGARLTDPATGAPLVLGEPLPPEPTGLDLRPRVTADEARAAFTREAVRGRWIRAPDDPLEATLGLAVVNGGYALVWRVRPLAGGKQLVIVDAHDAAARRSDSGIRCVTVPCP